MSRAEDARPVYDTAEAVAVYAEAASLMDVEDRIIRREVPTGARLLDLGCGTGRTTIPLARMGYRVTGVDLAPAMIAAAHARAPDLDFRVMDASALAFPDGAFDAACFLLNGLDCVVPRSARARVMTEVRRVLRPGGVFIYSSHNLIGMATTLRRSRLRTLRSNGLWRWIGGYLWTEEPEGGMWLYYGIPPLEVRWARRWFPAVRAETRSGRGLWAGTFGAAGLTYICR